MTVSYVSTWLLVQLSQITITPFLMFRVFLGLTAVVIIGFILKELARIRREVRFWNKLKHLQERVNDELGPEVAFACSIDCMSFIEQKGIYKAEQALQAWEAYMNDPARDNIRMTSRWGHMVPFITK